MAIGERIHFLRNLRGLTQRALGLMLGFPDNAADVRIAQYETDARKPREDLVQQLANALDVSPLALKVPDIDSDLGLMHTLFALEDRIGLTTTEVDGNVCLKLSTSNVKAFFRLYPYLTAWHEQKTRLERGEISQEDYDRWRYHFPRYDETRKWVTIPSEAISSIFSGDQRKK